MDGMKPCPRCGKEVREAAVFCRHCKRNLQAPAEAPVIDWEAIGERAREKLRILESGRIGDLPPGPGRVTAWTIVWGVGLVLSIGAMIAFPKEDVVIAFSAVILFISFLGFLVCGITDLVTVPPRGRTTPMRGAKAFYGALKRRHYRRAYGCLSPMDRTAEERTVPTLAKLDVKGEPFDFEETDGFKGYWKALVGPSSLLGGYHKRMEYRVLEVRKTGRGRAVAKVWIQVSGYPAWIIVTVLVSLLITLILMVVLTRREAFTVEKLLVEHDGLWWMANGELGSEEDEGIELLYQDPHRAREEPEGGAPELPDL